MQQAVWREGVRRSVKKSGVNKSTFIHEFAMSRLFGDVEEGVNTPSVGLDSQ